MHSIPIRLSVTQIICTKCNILSTFNSFLFIWGLFHLLYFKIFVSGIGSYCFHYRQQIYHKLFWLFNKNNSVIYRTHHKNSCPNDVTAAWATRIPWSINSGFWHWRSRINSPQLSLARLFQPVLTEHIGYGNKTKWFFF